MLLQGVYPNIVKDKKNLGLKESSMKFCSIKELLGLLDLRPKSHNILHRLRMENTYKYISIDNIITK